MRTLKFRFWDEKYNTWVNDPLFVYPSTEFVKQGIVIQQFTGLKDKNGKDIYEGDLVKSRNGIVYTCKYSEEECSFILDFIDSFVYLSDFDGLEVIGNIFEK